ncbi:MAG: hypothetical protein WAM44_21910 [Chthoniobacterales bacterium]
MNVPSHYACRAGPSVLLGVVICSGSVADSIVVGSCDEVSALGTVRGA